MDFYNKIRVMSYNIRYDNPWDKEHGWKYRKHMIPSMVRFHEADIVGMQEVLNHMLQYVKENLSEYAYVGVGRDDGDKEGEFNPIFYRKDRFEVIKSDTFWLSETPDKASKGWDAGCFRIVTWAYFRDKLTENKFYHFNTHLDNAGEVARREGSYLLLNKIEEIAGKEEVVVTGDFNCTEAEEPYKIITKGEGGFEEKVLKDALYISKYAHHGPTYTFKGDSFDENVKGKKIDFIFVKNNFSVIQHGILSDKWDEGYTSDHMPVIGDIIEVVPSEKLVNKIHVNLKGEHNIKVNFANNIVNEKICGMKWINNI